MDAKNKKLFSAACNHFDREEFEAALKHLLTIAKTESEEPLFFSTLGDTHEELGDFDRAIEAHTIAVKLAPDDEAYSIGLFHILWDHRPGDECMAEMERFLKVGKPVEYLTLWMDLTKTFGFMPISGAVKVDE